jgi:hypothetical protein
MSYISVPQVAARKIHFMWLLCCLSYGFYNGKFKLVCKHLLFLSTIYFSYFVTLLIICIYYLADKVGCIATNGSDTTKSSRPDVLVSVTTCDWSQWNVPHSCLRCWNILNNLCHIVRNFVFVFQNADHDFQNCKLLSMLCVYMNVLCGSSKELYI